MPRILLIVLLLSAFSIVDAQQKKQYAINGEIKGAPEGASIYILIMPPEIFDSCVVKDEQFSFTGTLSQPAEAIIWPGPISRMNDKRARLQCWIDEQPVHVSGSMTDFAAAEIRGGRAEADYLDYVKGLPANNDSMQMAYLLAYAHRHPDNYKVAQEVFFRRQSISLDVMKAIYKGYSARIKQSVFGESTGQYLSAAEQLKPGIAAPAFTLPDMHNKPTALADFKGKYVLLNVWASSCGPCRRKNPLLNEVYEKYKQHNFVILGVGLDQYDTFAAAIRKDQVEWPNTYDPSPLSSKMMASYNISTIPYMLLIDPEGKILVMNPGIEKTDQGYILTDDKGNIYGRMEDVLSGGQGKLTRQR